ncbi:MAG TPA: hypothetical protein PK733_05530 [Clostridiales bacterium]|nr:hypothetical protein [Clostridiales bacterium]
MAVNVSMYKYENRRGGKGGSIRNHSRAPNNNIYAKERRCSDAKSILTFKVAATYIGTVVGAGFASGQEILQFFSVFGIKGFWGLVLVTVLFVIYGHIIMELGMYLGSTSHLKIIRYAGGKYLGPVIDFLIIFFLFGSLTAMIAGSGAIFRQQFNIPAVWGNLVMAVITAITVLTGIEGVINSISFIVPFLIVAALGVGIASIFFVHPDYTHIHKVSGNGLIGSWLWAAILYASYNIILSVSVLAPLGNNIQNNESIKKGALLGGVSLGATGAAIYFTLVRNLGSIIHMEVPMAFIAGEISHVVQVGYIIVLLAEIYTTAVGSLYGFTARIINSDSLMNSIGSSRLASLTGKTCIVFTAFLAFITSRFGFSNLVSYLYPVMGYGGVILLVSLLYCKITKKVTGKKNRIQ